ncbi:MAG: pyridoxamine 5'-phosphate oxidase [Deltaproteobacteria bacterium]|nr:pyridoxamine 5'-phosphate oxidase [Deltaproteobacteria bacterium]MBN2670441.1 pyridoxamine 5'-phosphate oxidase [Deltaproteobacteria bacterium]
MKIKIQPNDVSAIPQDPYELISDIFIEAEKKIPVNPLSVVLATADKRGRPSSRTVLLKQYSRNGFVFFTNSQSRKGRQLDENPYCSLTFHFAALCKQVHVEGKAARIAAADSDSYFASRPRESQIGAWASAQSREIPEGDSPEQRYQEFDERFFHSDNVPRPGHWNGYRVVPERIEIWLEGAHRLHTRFCYTKENAQWRVARLFP